MIGRIQGRLLEKNPPQILVDVHGVGYEIDVPMSSFYNLPDVGGEVTLLTHFVVREAAQLLYGFLTAAEREAFRLLIRISGIGARTALSILSGMSVEMLAQAISMQDTAMLTRVPGIGKKTAERLVLELKGKIGRGFLILLGVAPDDTEEKCRKMADKLCSLRIFDDENDKINLSLDDVGGELLIISQFTLYGNCRKGRRPEFLSAARPEIAIPMYEKFVAICREKGYHVETGEFGAYMEVESLNDGPFTLIVDSADLDAPKKQ